MKSKSLTTVAAAVALAVSISPAFSQQSGGGNSDGGGKQGVGASSTVEKSGPSATPAQSAAPSTGSSTMGSSSQPVDDTLITTRVKARMATDKTVSATNINVKTVNGVVELSGTARSKAEADQAVAIARGVDGVKSVTNNLQFSSAAAPSSDRTASSTSPTVTPADRSSDTSADRMARSPRADRN